MDDIQGQQIVNNPMVKNKSSAPKVESNTAWEKIQSNDSSRGVFSEFLEFTNDESEVNEMDLEKEWPCQAELKQVGVNGGPVSASDDPTHRLTEAVGNLKLGGQTQQNVDPRCQGHDSNHYSQVRRMNGPKPGDQKSSQKDKKNLELIDGVANYMKNEDFQS